MELTTSQHIELGIRTAEAIRSENAGRSVRWLVSILHCRLGGWAY